jgi:nitrate reductase NapE component
MKKLILVLLVSMFFLPFLNLAIDGAICFLIIMFWLLKKATEK